MVLRKIYRNAEINLIKEDTRDKRKNTKRDKIISEAIMQRQNEGRNDKRRRELNAERNMVGRN